MFRPVLACLAVLAFCMPALAGTLSLEGKFVQGGLIIGKTEAGARISLDGRAVRVDSSGRFVFGFGRDAKKDAVLTAEFADGTREVRNLSIKQRTYRIQRIDGLPAKMVTPSKEALKRIRAEGKKIREARGKYTPAAYFAGGMIWPAKGRISGVYGSQRILNGKPRRPHLGIDVAAPAGTPIVAAATGTVTLADPDLYFTGGTVIIDHGHGLSTVYSHLKSVGVRTGQSVQQGDKIGTLGATGRATGPHLDWRVNWFQERLDPLLIVGPMPK